MKIDHIALWTNDLEQMKLFYTKYFNGIATGKYTNNQKQFESYFLLFESGTRLELMRKPDLVRRDSFTSLGYAHLAFSVGSKERVIQLTETIRNDGYTINSEPRITGDGYFESCIIDPEGNLIEITI